MNLFEILIYSIAAFALILVFLGIIYYFTEQETNTKIIQRELIKAQAQINLGKTINGGQLNFEKDNSMEKSDIEKENTLVSFECINPQNCCTRETDRDKTTKCDKAIRWDYDFVQFNENKRITLNTRCERISGVPVCKVYISGTPPQAKVKKIELLTKTLGTGEIKVTVENSGGQTLTFGKNTLTLFKKVTDGWQETNYPEEIKEVETIASGESYSFLWSINPKNSGNYRADFKFEAKNGGFDENGIEFVIDKTLSCKIDSRAVETTFDSATGNYLENYYCTGCSYSFECSNAWTAEYPTKNFIVKTKDATYCVKQEANGSC